ncbi:MAG: SDR family NAD(P)-dependent oxidoreductase [Myxococcaceae bacterium]|nr:SDR family NAD(P)-dependent oxidoreductase [Myxococcaceae bacterium]MCI0671010.1 SDR family NAD(P)-dependent oxidoreductase [Myxococcaceae bacterium]
MSFKKAVVVGASSGIGEAVALELARRGAQLALVARREEELKRVAEAAREAGAPSVHVHVHDVMDTRATPALFERIVQELGGLDTLVYAAGVMPPVEVDEYSFEKDRQMVGVNLLGAMAWLDLAAVRFEAERSGTLVGISSIAGVRGRRGNPAYCTTKAALTTFLESLRNRLAVKGVNVVTIQPGFVDTAMTRGRSGLFWLVSPEEAARDVLAVASRGRSASAFVPRRWGLVAAVVRALPSSVFRRLNL